MHRTYIITHTNTYRETSRDIMFNEFGYQIIINEFNYHFISA